MLTTRGVSLALLISFLPAAASVGGTDVVQVANGDRFTGTISRLDRGKLLFGTDAAGTIPIAYALESHDSDPPGDRRRSDFGVSSTLGWSF